MQEVCITKITLIYLRAAWIQTCGPIKSYPQKEELHTTMPRHRVLKGTLYLRLILNGGCC